MRVQTAIAFGSIVLFSSGTLALAHRVCQGQADRYQGKLKPERSGVTKVK